MSRKGLKEGYITNLASAIFKQDYNFFLNYAPGALTQFADPLKKFDNLTDEQKKMYIKAAEAAFDVCAPKILREGHE